MNWTGSRPDSLSSRTRRSAAAGSRAITASVAEKIRSASATSSSSSTSSKETCFPP